MSKKLVAWIVVLVISAVPTLAFGAGGEQDFRQGKKLLGQGDFQGAMEAFASATRADRTNADYMQNYAILRQVVMLQAALEKEQDAQRWEYYARGLHSYYISEGLYEQALKLDLRMHEKLDTATSAALLAETQLAMDRNAEAAEVLAKLAPEKANVVTRSLQGIALARLGKAEDAGKLAEEVALSDANGPGVIYCVARLKAATGHGAEASTLLARCFEQVPPSQLAAFKIHAKATPEFASMAGSTHFEEALATESKVQESSCSSGSSCASCPMRGNCGQE